MANSRKGGFGKRVHPFINAESFSDERVLIPTIEYLIQTNPELKDMLRPDYQHNYFDPPHDEELAKTLANVERLPTFLRLNYLRSRLPKSLEGFKELMSHIPIAQMQQLREQLYISRVGDLGTNAPCTFTRRHWINRLYNEPEPLTASSFPQHSTAQRIRWFDTAVANLSNDAAEEEYIRYRLCLRNRMPLVAAATAHNPLHHNAISQYHDIGKLLPKRACTPLLSLVHDANRHFHDRKAKECGHYIPAFRKAMISEPNLKEAMLSYDSLQRCMLGRELRARLMTDPPVMARAWSFFGRRFVSNFLPNFITNSVEIHSNPVVEFTEHDNAFALNYDNGKIPIVAELLKEIEEERSGGSNASSPSSALLFED